MERILACIDTSPSGRNAAAWAEALASAVGADVAVVPISGQLVAGAEPPDLVVVGSDAARWFPALHLDHPAHALVTHARWPLAVVPLGVAPGVSRLVVGVDGTPSSLGALEWVATQLAPLGADILAVHAVPARMPARVAVGGGGGTLRTWVSPLVRPGGEPELRECEGDPVVGLLGAADAEPGTAIVLGGRRADRGHRFSIGSVGLRILDRAEVAVVVVPAPPG